MYENRARGGGQTRPIFERLLLSDAARWLAVPALVVALALMLHGYGKMVADSSPSLDAFRESPQRFVGGPFTVSFGKVARVGERSVRLRRDEVEIDVVIDDPALSVGSIVSVRGFIRPDLRLEARELRVHRGRRIKWLIGGSVLLLTLMVAGREL